MRIRYSTIIFGTILICQILNIGNYSFLYYSIDGIPISNPIFSILRSSRLTISLIPLFTFLFTSKDFKYKVSKFFFKNIDVLFFCIIPFFGIINGVDKTSAILYSFWNFGCVFSICLFIVNYTDHYNQIEVLSKMLRVLLYGSIVVIPLLCLDIGDFGKGRLFEMKFTSKGFWPYCLLSIIIAAFGLIILNKKYKSELKYKNIISILIILSFLFLIGGIRRTPLIVGFLLLVSFLFFGIDFSYKFKIIFIGLILSISIIFIPIIIDKYSSEIAVFEKLSRLSIEDGKLSEGQFSSSYSDRILIRNSYLVIFEDYPLFGLGLNNGTALHKIKYPYWALGGYSTHNTFLAFLVETGILGFFCFILVLIRSIFISVIQEPKIRYILLSSIIACCLINWNEINSLGGQVFYWPSFLIFIAPRIFLKF